MRPICTQKKKDEGKIDTVLKHHAMKAYEGVEI
jgi:hypothetical protein